MKKNNYICNMNNSTIKSNEEYLEALKRFEEIFFAKKGTKESDEADVLSILITDYEKYMMK